MVQGTGSGTNDEDDMNQPIILFKKSGGKKSTYPNTNEERTSSSSKPKKIIVYTRTRIRGSSKNGDSCDGKIHLDASGPTNRQTAPVNVDEVPARPESTTCVDDYNGKQVEEQSQSGFACNDIIDTVLQLAPPSIRKAKDATGGFSNSIKIIHQKVNKDEERVKYDLLDRPPMSSAKERQFMLRMRQKARIAMRNTSVATKPQFARVEQGHTASLLMSAPLVTAHKLSHSGPSNLNPGCSGSCSQQLTVGSKGKNLQQFPPWLFSGSGNNMKTPSERSQHIHSRERSQHIHSRESNALVKVWFEEELDALWKGVRRHGEGNWEAIIKDPTLHFSSNKKPEHLSQKWSVEKLKALGVNEEPARLPKEQQPKVAERAPGKSKKRHRSLQKDSENATLLLGGFFHLSDANITGFEKSNDSSDTNDQKEISSEATISD